jgi:hypothetical protein
MQQEQKHAAAEKAVEPVVAQTEEVEEETEEEVTVQVGDRRIPLSEVTPEDISKMTKEENEDYYAKYQNALAAYYG